MMPREVKQTRQLHIYLQHVVQTVIYFFENSVSKYFFKKSSSQPPSSCILNRAPLKNHSTLLKHTTTLFSLSDHYILSREWRVIVDQVHTNYHGGPMVL